MGFFDKIFKRNKDKSVSNSRVEQNNIAPRETITKSKKTDKVTTKQEKELTFRVAGVTFNGIQGKLKAMVKDEKELGDSYEGLSNKEILEAYSEDDKIYEVEIAGSNEIKLIPDPKNKFDTNAIKVLLDEVGDIGYVPATDCKRVKKILEDGYSIQWRLLGGKHKYIEYDEEKDKDVVKIENNTYGIMITLIQI